MGRTLYSTSSSHSRRKILIFLLGQFIDFGTSVVRLFEIFGLDLTNFWFPMPFYEFFKAKCQVKNYRIQGAEVRLNASQADAYFRFLSESLWNFCECHSVCLRDVLTCD